MQRTIKSYDWDITVAGLGRGESTCLPQYYSDSVARCHMLVEFVRSLLREVFLRVL